MPKSPAQRKREERQRKRDKGLIPFHAWVLPRQVKRIRRFIESLTEN